MSNSNEEFSSFDSDSRNKQYSNNKEPSNDINKRINNFFKQPKLFLVPNLQEPIKIEIGNKIVSPFENLIHLSFAQRDRYIYELGWFLKKNYGDVFKDDWCYFKYETDKHSLGEDIDVEEIWDNIDPNNLYQDGFDLEIHSFALKLMSKIFLKITNLNNEHKPFYEIKNKIKQFTESHFIYHQIKDKILDKFLVDEDYTSYIYDEETKLFTFNSTLEKTIKSLKTFLTPFKKNIQKLSFYINNQYNSLTLSSLISNIEKLDVQKKILDIFKDKIRIKFNNNQQYEIAYKDKIFNLKDKTLRERTHLDYYTTTIDSIFLKNYNKVPKYIRSVFGDDEDELKKIQILLGSSFIGSALDHFILFYGEGSNSKSKLLSILKEILNGFQLNLDYEKYIRDKEIDSLMEKYNFEQKRIIAIDDLNINTFLKDESKFTRLLNNRRFNFISSINKRPTYSNIYALKRRLIELEFPFTFVEDPINEREKELSQDLKINKDYIFTWLVKGAFMYIENKKERDNNDKLKSLILEAEQKYDSDFDDFSDEEPFVKSEPKPEIKIDNPIVKFIKEYTIPSVNGKINKKYLHELFILEHGIEKDLREFNKIIRDEFKLGEKKSNGMYYWIGISLIEN